jgi:hypothetical protein
LKGGPFLSISNSLPILSTNAPIRVEYDVHLTLSDHIHTPTIQESIELPELDRL